MQPRILSAKIYLVSSCLAKKEKDEEVGALTAMVALVLTVPALAQEGVSAVGVLEKPEATTYMYGTHAITDESSGAFYALESDVLDLDAYIGQRVTVYGTLVSGYESGQVEGGPPLVEVTQMAPADAPADTTSFVFFGYEPAFF
jgi:hypothetical protein